MKYENDNEEPGIISLTPLMNDEWESQILNYVGKHIITKQNVKYFLKYLEQRILNSKCIHPHASKTDINK
jgi:hypothetical protein